jgi:hypothetical protein
MVPGRAAGQADGPHDLVPATRPARCRRGRSGVDRRPGCHPPWMADRPRGGRSGMRRHDHPGRHRPPRPSRPRPPHRHIPDPHQPRHRTTPAGTTPAGTTPAGTTPAGTTPAGTTPAGTTPAWATRPPASPATGQRDNHGWPAPRSTAG